MMKYAGILVVMGGLSVAGMPGVAGAYDGQSMPWGHVQQISDVRDPNGGYAGSIDQDGTVRDRDGGYAGGIDRDGTVRDRNGGYAGEIDRNGTLYGRNGGYAGSIDRGSRNNHLSDADRTAGALILLHRLPR
ncbi:hypothetical protein NQF87_08340 [Bombella sp. TMW 2.2559]|uniref:Uncharacterized protein n=1 Tax=Bombella dulcis TaxID=2967339 RepID=A0ABT3WD17_9PROT|nr:hypothetical protein [Bombella dulcis]MCX5616974.1 hypothetical protein [Bombella dulcis]